MSLKNNKAVIILSVISLVLIVAPFLFKPFANRSYQEMLQSLPEFSAVTMFSKEKITTQIQEDQYTFFVSDKISYNKYEKINFKLGVVDKKTGMLTTNLIPIIKIYNEKNELLKNIFNQEMFTMIFNKELNVFEYELYLKDSPNDGVFIAKVSFETSIFNKFVEQEIPITIIAERSTYILPHSYAFLGLDSKEILSLKKILSTNGQETSFSEITKWFDLLNTDAIMMPSAVTKKFEKDNTAWDMQKLKESKSLAKTFSQTGQDVALWIQALEMENLDNSKYNYTLSRNIGKSIQDRNIISLKDQKRKEELQLIFEDHMKDNNIDYVGFSKVFFEQYHEELFQEFPQTFNESIPNISEAFNIWKEYQAVAYFRELINSTDKKKPVFFIFTGEELSSNPRFLDMAFATGIDFVFLDLSVSIKNLPTQFDMINKDNVLDKYKDRIVLSYCLNYNNLVSGQSSAVDNWVSYNLSLYNDYGVNTIRIKDFYRAMFGNRGSYLAYEWMLSVGDLIGQWKQNKNIYPLEQSYITSNTEVSDVIELTIELQNVSSQSISNISVDFLPLIDINKKYILSISELLEGEIYRTNITISNIQFKQSLLKKRARFIGIKSSFKQKQLENNKIQERIHLISFIDPNVENDQILSVQDDFNEQIKITRDQELKSIKEEKTRQTALSNKLAKETRLLEEQREEQEQQEQQNKEIEIEIEIEEEEKLSFWERRKQKKEQEEIEKANN